MHATGSFIMTALERIRAYLDSPELDAKYNNDFIVRHILMPAMSEVWSNLQLDADNPIVVRYDQVVTVSQEYYQLPPHVQWVWRISQLDAGGVLIADAYPRGFFSPQGPGYTIEGNQLAIRPFPSIGQTITIWYVPSGDVGTHYSTTGSSFSRANDATTGLPVDTVTLGTPAYGWIDKRPNAYAGCVFRLLSASNGVLDEKVISSYNATTGVVVLRGALATASAPSANSAYEIAPLGTQPLYEAIACKSAMKLGTIMKISGVHNEMLRHQYAAALKALRDIVASMQMRAGHGVDRSTIDNTALGWYSWRG